ncbi:hypothetical protein ACSS1H_12195 [Acinetobacter baumannii]|uniref:hypothetical protein n=1 Tax=Acinetobacter baumannii TaxID=470 RepID=UPI003EDA1FBF
MYTNPKKGIKFISLPDILIQDPSKSISYLITAEKMVQYKLKPTELALIDDNVVTFVIPDDELVDEIPPFLKSDKGVPSVLIQHPVGSASYLLSNQELSKYEVSQEVIPSYGLAFVMPTGMELIEDLPPLMAATLQSGESVSDPTVPCGGGSGHGGGICLKAGEDLIQDIHNIFLNGSQQIN